MNPPSTLFDRLGGRPTLQVLLRRFYADVRQHEVIGPVFSARIHDWPAHLEKLADFWSGLTGGPARYGGGMAARHSPLRLEDAHFQAWLELWERHCRAHLPRKEAEEMVAIAQALGQRLRAITAAQHGPRDQE